MRICFQYENGINLKVPNNNSSGFKNISRINENGRQQKWQVQYIRNRVKGNKRFYNFIDAYSYLKNECDSSFEYELLEDKKIKLRYASFQEFDVSNGQNNGATIFTQFCSHKCKGCQNPQTWTKDGGYVFDKKVYDKLFETLKKPYIKRLTLSGGEPMDNLQLSNLISAEFKYRFPNKQLWIYTGYTYEELKDKYECQVVLELCDYLVDGEYIDELRDVTLAYRGSSNQRIIDMNATRNNGGEIVLWKNTSF